MGQPHIRSGSACSSYCTCVPASIAIGPVWRSFNGRTRKYRRALSTQHDLYCSDYWKQPPEYREQAARGHRGRRPLSLKKGRRSEARPAPPRRIPRLARQRIGPRTSRGRPDARHPPLRGDTTTPGRLPGDLRRRLDHDGQARCSRPARASLPGPFALAQPASPAAAPGTGSSPEEEVTGSTPWVVGACVTRGGHRMSAWSRCQRCHELLARTTVREAAQALLRRRCIRPGPFHQVQGHRLGRRLVSTTAEDIEAVSLEAKILRARSRPRLQPTCRISALKNPVRSRAGVPR